MKTDTLSLAALQKMPRPELIDLAKGFNRLESKVTKARDALKVSHKSNGKCIHVLKTEWLTLRESGKVSSSVTYPEHHKALTGDLPTKRGYQCAVVFGLLVVSAKLIDEQKYDDQPVECVTETSVIIGLAQMDPAHEAVKSAVDILKRRPDKAIEQLRAIKDRFVTRTEGKGDDEKETTVFLTEAEAQAEANAIEPQEAAQLAGKIAKQDIGVLIAEICAVAQTTDDAVTAKRIVHGIVNMQKAFAANVDGTNNRRFAADELNGWAAELNSPKSLTEADYKAKYQSALAELAEVENAMLQVDAGLTGKWAAEVCTPVSAMANS